MDAGSARRTWIVGVVGGVGRSDRILERLDTGVHIVIELDGGVSSCSAGRQEGSGDSGKRCGGERARKHPVAPAEAGRTSGVFWHGITPERLNFEGCICCVFPSYL